MKHKFKNIYFAIKAFFLSFTAFVILMLIIFVSAENAVIEKKLNEIKADEKMFVALTEEFFVQSLKSSVLDLKYLSENFDASNENTDIQWKTLIESGGKYSRIRFVDEYGDEVFTVNHSANDYEVSANISEETYFINTLELPEGQIYISEMVKRTYDENDEFSIMICTHVSSGDAHGIIVLEFDAVSLIERVRQDSDDSLGEIFLINDLGYWSSSKDVYNEIDSYYYQISYNAGILPPEKWESLQDESHNIEDTGLYTFKEINYIEAFGAELKDLIVVKENNCKILTLIGVEGEYDYYFKNEITAKIARIFEERYMYFVGCAIIAITIVIFLLTNKNNLDKMRNSSHYDPLTKVYNRRQGFELLAEQIANIKRYKRLCLCFIDINGLKEVNDTLGHSYGDELILTVTDTIKNTIRQDDMIIRMGGDEFLIVLTKVGKSIAETIWTRIVDSFKNINSLDNRKYIISVSHGIVEVSHEDSDIDLNAIITEADDKMYKEKMRIKKSIKIIRRST